MDLIDRLFRRGKNGKSEKSDVVSEGTASDLREDSDIRAEAIKSKMDVGDDRLDHALSVGLEVSISDEGLSRAKDGFFYKGRRVLVYIKDQYSKYADGGYKFHICVCRTLMDMERQGRIDRYIVTNNTSGVFEVNIIDGSKRTNKRVAMKVCRNCLAKLNYEKYSSRKDYVYENFSIEEFFRKYGRFIGTPPA